MNINWQLYCKYEVVQQLIKYSLILVIFYHVNHNIQFSHILFSDSAELTHTGWNAKHLTQVVNFISMMQVGNQITASLLASSSCIKTMKIRLDVG